jgi:hypothetical protein
MNDVTHSKADPLDQHGEVRNICDTEDVLVRLRVHLGAQDGPVPRVFERRTDVLLQVIAVLARPPQLCSSTPKVDL